MRCRIPHDKMDSSISTSSPQYTTEMDVIISSPGSLLDQLFWRLIEYEDTDDA